MAVAPTLGLVLVGRPDISLCASLLECVRRTFFSSASILRLLGAGESTIPMMPQLIVPTHCMLGVYARFLWLVPEKQLTAFSRQLSACSWWNEGCDVPIPSSGHGGLGLFVGE